MQITNSRYKLEEEYVELIREELNVKEVKIISGDGEQTVVLDTTSTPELVAEGRMRQLVRAIQILRKEKGCTINAHIRVQVPEEYKELSQEFVDRVKKKRLLMKLYGEIRSRY